MWKEMCRKSDWKSTKKALTRIHTHTQHKSAHASEQASEKQIKKIQIFVHILCYAMLYYAQYVYYIGYVLIQSLITNNLCKIRIKLTHFKRFTEVEFILAELWSGSSQVKLNQAMACPCQIYTLCSGDGQTFFPFIVTICWNDGCALCHSVRLCVLAAAAAAVALHSILTEVTVLKSHWNGPNRL